MMKLTVFMNLVAVVSCTHFISHVSQAPETAVPPQVFTEDVYLFGPSKLDARSYQDQTIPSTNEIHGMGVIAEQGTGMSILEQDDATGLHNFIELGLLHVDSNFLRVTLFNPTNSPLYAGAYCLSKSGESCGFSAHLLNNNVDNYLAWIVTGSVSASHVDRIRWSIFYREGDEMNFGSSYDVLYQGSKSTCTTSPLQTPCELLCYKSDEVSRCTESLTLSRLPCTCSVATPVVDDSDFELATRIIAILIIIVISSILACCIFYWWRTRIEAQAAQQVEIRRQQMQTSEPQSQAEIEATATSLMEQLTSSSNSPDGQACCVCLETTSASASSPDAEDSWIRTPCNHNMHHDCLKQWLVQRLTKKHAMTCPVCRASLSETVGSPPRTSIEVSGDASPDSV
eukprot:TRINITY_DN18772_c0_g1_i1.p1 TRINITY_DN18772_c0_g1~~TRINITY_DN18772_c0_g1_i1.p1  ORF type:complete len:398 (+),score=49.54 TRINITY_DN18772_c0_g1_i1:72-1265(+)